MKSNKIRLGLLLALILSSALLVGCTENIRARAFGGTATVNLPAGKKVVTASFKQNDLWILTRAAQSGEKAETFELIESSNFGLLEGKVIIVEKQ